ncbi:MAG: CYTH domain-containing protein, partial [Victivallaceae bacterium]|nr:CYTH domain-containing protein [Victivallaceae bacterium]
MGCEIERKFLTLDDSWKKSACKRLHIVQGYARTAHGALSTIRFRIVDETQGFLTLKGCVRDGVRSEFEYAIPAADVRAMLAEFGERPPLEKYRYLVRENDRTWEIDEFLGANAGLVVAEIELEAPGAPFGRPAWLGRAVTH